MKKILGFTGAIALTLTPSTLTAENLIPKESHTTQTVRFLNNDLRDGILISMGCLINPGANLEGAKYNNEDLEGAIF